MLTVCIKHIDGSIDVVSLAWSQFCDLISDMRFLDKCEKNNFFNGNQSVDLPDGRNIKILKTIRV